MAVTKIGHQNSAKHLKNAIDYICSPSKTGGGRWVGAHNCDCGRAYEDFLATKQYQSERRGRKDVLEGRQGYHIVISFSDRDQEKMTPEMAMQIVGEFVEKYIPDYESVFSVHTNTEHMHCHLIWNSIDMVEGKKYHYAPGDWARYIQPITNSICKKYNLDTICIDGQATTENLDYGTWKKKKSGLPIQSDYMRYDIDKAIEEVKSKDGTYDDFLNLLREYGYQLRGDNHTKTLTLSRPGEENGIPGEDGTRTHRLGTDYAVDAIKARISGQYDREMPDEMEPVSPIILSPAVKSCHMPDELIKFISTPVRFRPANIHMAYAIRVYRGRRAWAYTRTHTRKTASPRMWTDRGYSIRLNELAGDLSWLVRNRGQAGSLDQIRQLKAQYNVKEAELQAQRKKINQCKYRLISKRKKIADAISSGQKGPEALKELKEIDEQLQEISEELVHNRADTKEIKNEIQTAARIEKDYETRERLKQEKEPEERRREDGRNATDANNTDRNEPTAGFVI